MNHILMYSDMCPLTFSFDEVDLRIYQPGPSCSKLTMLLIEVSLKFQTFISEICQYFLLKKCEKLLHCKSVSFFQQKYHCIWL